MGGAAPRILIVEDQTILRELLVELLTNRGGFEVTCAVGSIQEAQTVLDSVGPNMIILETELPDGSGVNWIRAIKAERPELKVIFFTTMDSEQMALAAIGSGAEGYILKSNSVDRLLDTVKTISCGECVFEPSIAAPILRRIGRLYYSTTSPDNKCSFEALSEREREVATLACQGLTNEEIAEAIFVTVNTVKTHLRRIYKRLGISSRRQLMQLQQQNVNTTY
jgi:DNA-binding NarL/FixJ family response regulator